MGGAGGRARYSLTACTSASSRAVWEQPVTRVAMARVATTMAATRTARVMTPDCERRTGTVGAFTVAMRVRECYSGELGSDSVLMLKFPAAPPRLHPIMHGSMQLCSTLDVTTTLC